MRQKIHFPMGFVLEQGGYLGGGYDIFG
jgi:hypothetical protein